MERKHKKNRVKEKNRVSQTEPISYAVSRKHKNIKVIANWKRKVGQKIQTWIKPERNLLKTKKTIVIS